ncbi:hypothetical protein QBC39DRAFT_43580 [Podospora conica]|nr:hypothetical protein QBC39DRAFT_43580 [Schizothecium conicum]
MEAGSRRWMLSLSSKVACSHGPVGDRSAEAVAALGVGKGTVEPVGDAGWWRRGAACSRSALQAAVSLSDTGDWTRTRPPGAGGAQHTGAEARITHGDGCRGDADGANGQPAQSRRRRRFVGGGLGARQWMSGRGEQASQSFCFCRRERGSRLGMDGGSETTGDGRMECNGVYSNWAERRGQVEVLSLERHAAGGRTKLTRDGGMDGMD